jgi:hypothetical protein
MKRRLNLKVFVEQKWDIYDYKLFMGILLTLARRSATPLFV